MRVLCLISAMGPGGAERVMAQLTAFLSERHEVRLVTLETPGTASFYPLAHTVDVVQLGLLSDAGPASRLAGVFGRFGAARRQIEAFKPDVVVSFMDTMNILATIVSWRAGVPVVISERVDPAHHRLGPGKSLARRLIYPLADCCVVQTERVRAYFSGAYQPALTVIPNPVPLPEAQAGPERVGANGRFRVIAVGRLDAQKGFDRLLAAFARVATAHLDWELVIYGEGTQRGVLTALIADLDLTGRVALPGLTKAPADEYAASNIVALPSRYEGFPNALAEGMAAGLPAVGYVGVSGVEDLVLDDETGLLADPANEVVSLAAALDRLMGSAELRVRLGAAARRHMVQWRPDLVYRRWEDLLAGVAKKAL